MTYHDIKYEQRSRRWTLVNNDRGLLWVDMITTVVVRQSECPKVIPLGSEQSGWGCTIHQPTKRMVRILAKEFTAHNFDIAQTAHFRVSAIFPDHDYIGTFIVSGMELLGTGAVRVTGIGLNTLRRRGLHYRGKPRPKRKLTEHAAQHQEHNLFEEVESDE